MSEELMDGATLPVTEGAEVNAAEDALNAELGRKMIIEAELDGADREVCTADVTAIALLLLANVPVNVGLLRKIVVG